MPAGSAYTTWVSIEANCVSIPVDHPDLSVYRVGDNGTSYFCSHCGTKLCGIDKRYSDIVGFLAGTLRGFEVQAAEADYFYSDKAPWHRHGNAPIRYDGDGEEQQLSG